MQTLRPYQSEDFQRIRIEASALKKANRRVAILYVLACGGGKTTVISHLVMMVDKKGNHTLFLVRKEELLDQGKNRLEEHDIKAGVIKSGRMLQIDKSVYVCSTPTLVNRFKNANPEMKMWNPRGDVIIIDECHEAISPTTLKVLEQYPEAMIIGITATPQRTDGKGLGVSVGGIFESMIVGPSPRALIQMGFLVPYRLFEPPVTFDFSGVSVTAKGEYNDGAAAAVVDKPDLIGDVHKNWSLHAADRKTIIFAQGRDHGKHILKDFLDKGVAAVYVDGDNSYTSKEKRLAVPRDFKSGKYQVVINVNVYNQGVDFPFCDCVVIARGTASLIFWIQMTGRGLRTNPGKSDVIIIDHAGNAKFRFDLPDHEHEWSLEGRRKKNKPKIPSLHTCEKCFALFRSNIHTCPECGYCWWNVAERGELPSVVDAILVEHKIEDRPLTKKQIADDLLEEQKIYLAEMVLKQISNSYKFKFALTRFKERYGSWPKKKHDVNIEWVTTDETLPGTERFKMKIVAWELNGHRYSDPVMDDLPEAVG